MGPTWRGSTGNSDSSSRGLMLLAIQVAILLLSIKQSGDGRCVPRDELNAWGVCNQLELLPIFCG